MGRAAHVGFALRGRERDGDGRRQPDADSEHDDDEGQLHGEEWYARRVVHGRNVTEFTGPSQIVTGERPPSPRPPRRQARAQTTARCSRRTD